MITDEQIISLLKERQSSQDARIARMRKIRDAYHHDIIVPLPELDSADEPVVANTLNVGIDAFSQRVSSVLPTVKFFEQRNTKIEREHARTRRDVIYSWWDSDRMALQLGQRARWFAAYASSVVHIVPDAEEGRPCYRLRDPLTAYPSSHEYECENAIFTYRQSLGWVERNYGVGVRHTLGLKDARATDMIDLVEYVDAQETVLLAQASPRDFMGSMFDGKVTIRVNRAVNRLDVCPVVALGRPGLSGPIGQFDGMIGAYWQQAMLSALEVIAVKRGVFPDRYLIGAGGQNPQVVREADGLRGITGIVSDGQLTQFSEQPGYMTNQTIDRLERSQRVAGRIPPEFGGESSSNIRTGRRGDSVLAAVVDFPIMEVQRAFSECLRAENNIAIQVDKAWFKGSKKVWVSWRGTQEREVTYNNTIWDSDRHVVTYSHPGADTNGLGIAFGQRVGMGTMSKFTAMNIDPMVDDADFEHDMIQAEQLEAALLASVAQQANQGAIPPNDLARIVQMVRDDDIDLADAVMKAQQEAQARQAKLAPPGSPETQPGLAQPGAGAEQPTIPQAPAGARNLAGLMSALRLPQMTVPAEQVRPGG